MKRVLAVLAATMAGVVALAFAISWFLFDADELGQRLLDDLETKTGLELDADRFHFGLLEGLRVEGLSARGRVEQGDLSLAIDQLILEPRLKALLRGRVVVDRIEIRRPMLLIEVPRGPSLGRGGPAREPSESGGPELSFSVSEIEVVSGQLELREEDESGAVITGLGARMVGVALDPDARTPFEGVRADGTIRAADMSFGKFVARNGFGRLELDSGHVRLDNFRFDHKFGPMNASVDVDFSREPFTYLLDLDGESLDLAPALKSSGGDEPIPATLTFDATGIGPEPEGLAGRGVVHVEGGAIPSSPIVNAIEFLLGGGVRLAGAEAEVTEIRFTIDDNAFSLEPFVLRFEGFEIAVEGDVELDGPLGLRLKVATARDSVKVREFPHEVYDALTNEAGDIVVPIDIGGTLESPRATVDWTELAKIVGDSLGRSWKERGDELLKKLFGSR